MRIFEMLFIVANLLSLVLGFNKLTKGAWLGAAGGNLALFLIHALFEGVRYQMAFSYVFVILFVVAALLKTNDRFFRAKMPKAPRIFAISLAFILLSLTAFLAYALPVFRLPLPTGSYAVGVQYFHFIDENRTDPFLEPSVQKRELMVKVFYPAIKDNAKPYARYFHQSPELIRMFTAFYHLPEFAFDQLNLVKTNSKEGLLLSDQEPSYPVVLFSHGAGTTVEVQTTQGEDLASHGYIVAAIDHTYVSSATLFPDRIVSHHEATTIFDSPEPAEIITQIMADDAKFVIEMLGEMNQGEFGPLFQGKINLDKIGAAGHSVGGATAYNLAINDHRVKAAIDIDGTVFITPDAHGLDMAPFLMLANDEYHIQAIQKRENLMKKLEDMPEVDQEITRSIYGAEAYQQAYNKAQQNVIGLTEVLKTSGNLYTIEGSNHMKFIDIGLFIGVRPLRELIHITGKTDPAKCLEITRSVTLAFFDQHLKGESIDTLESLVETYPELKKVDMD